MMYVAIEANLFMMRQGVGNERCAGHGPVLKRGRE